LLPDITIVRQCVLEKIIAGRCFYNVLLFSWRFPKQWFSLYDTRSFAGRLNGAGIFKIAGRRAADDSAAGSGYGEGIPQEVRRISGEGIKADSAGIVTVYSFFLCTFFKSKLISVHIILLK
jgi:hypothetical protein